MFITTCMDASHTLSITIEIVATWQVMCICSNTYLANQTITTHLPIIMGQKVMYNEYIAGNSSLHKKSSLYARTVYLEPKPHVFFLLIAMNIMESTPPTIDNTAANISMAFLLAVVLSSYWEN